MYNKVNMVITVQVVHILSFISQTLLF